MKKYIKLCTWFTTNYEKLQIAKQCYNTFLMLHWFIVHCVFTQNKISELNKSFEFYNSLILCVCISLNKLCNLKKEVRYEILDYSLIACADRA